MEWTKYTTKEALKDNDELMILDKDANANKRTLMDKVWDYVVDKMTTAVIAKLGTTNKTLIGAVNELNSKSLTTQIKNIDSSTNIDNITNGIYFCNGFEVLKVNKYGVFLSYTSQNNAVKTQMLCTTTNEMFIRSYGSSTGWTNWKEIK